ncbi:MAG: transposase [Proteobacteria bacterium]|nr:transposase [Pseudomonadota bacterium]
MGRTIPLPWRTHGGPRAGAGRPPRGSRSSERHKARPRLAPDQPLHVVMRVVAGMNLRRAATFAAIRDAMAIASHLRIVHVSVQATHVHLIVEATTRLRLARGMQGFQISAARRINRALDREGQVFVDRYHATPLSSPRQVRNTIAYVLNNWRHHGLAKAGAFDPCSSAASFDGWKPTARKPAPFLGAPLPVATPRTWLLAVGWRRHQLVSVKEVPGGNHAE